MRSPLQEKIQVTVKSKTEAGEGWASFESNREPQNLGDTFNKMPPGMDISNQDASQIKNMPLSCAGETDVSADTSTTAFMNGFTRRPMKGIDDQYTDEHVDLFYTKAIGDEGEGFAERQNYLDRI